MKSLNTGLLISCITYEYMKKVVDLVEFKASNSWLSRFKKRDGIVSRKVTKIILTNYVQDQETIKQSANEFLNNSKQVMQSFDE